MIFHFCVNYSFKFSPYFPTPSSCQWWYFRSVGCCIGGPRCQNNVFSVCSVCLFSRWARLILADAFMSVIVLPNPCCSNCFNESCASKGKCGRREKKGGVFFLHRALGVCSDTSHSAPARDLRPGCTKATSRSCGASENVCPRPHENTHPVSRHDSAAKWHTS